MTTTKKATSERATKAAATRAANKEKLARMQGIVAALATERTCFNNAVRDGAVAILKTAFGDYQVEDVDSNHWYHCRPAGKEMVRRSDDWSYRHFAGCNDGKWADLLRQANIQRHPLFAKWA
mgnify:CR=1 FL=1